jgi:hypothetical protein
MKLPEDIRLKIEKRADKEDILLLLARLESDSVAITHDVYAAVVATLESFWIDPRQDTPRCRGRVRRRMRSQPRPTRSRTRGQRTATGPMPVMISRSGRCPWRTNRWPPSSVSLSACTEQGCHLASVTRSIRMRFSIHTASRNGNCSYGGLTLTLGHFRPRLRQPWRTRLGPISRRSAASARSAVASSARNAPRSA